MKTIKSVFVLTLALALNGAAPALAQQQENTTFKPHWYIQPQVGAGIHTGEAKFSKLLTPAAQLSVGRQFSPLFGLRLGASGWQARNWQVTPQEEYKWKHVQASLDATLSLTNLFGGYDANRCWNLYAFVGGGLNVAFDNDEANGLAVGHPVEFSKAWDGTIYSPAARAGLGLEFALSERVAIGLEANANMLPDKWNSKRGSDADWQNHLLVGVKIALGKTSERTEEEPYALSAFELKSVDSDEQQATETPVVVEQPVQDVPQATAVIEVEKEAPVVEQPVKDVPQTPAAEETQKVASAAKQTIAEEKEDVKIYFPFNSTRISLKEAAKLRQLARNLSSNRKLRVTINGYASPEGNSDYNMLLSGWRADAVKNCLVSYGVNGSRITTVAKGEIDLGNGRESRSAICITTE